jgi:hypothetical protein
MQRCIVRPSSLPGRCGSKQGAKCEPQTGAGTRAPCGKITCGCAAAVLATFALHAKSDAGAGLISGAGGPHNGKTMSPAKVELISKSAEYLTTPAADWAAGWRVAPQLREVLVQASRKQWALLSAALLVPLALAALFAFNQRAGDMSEATEGAQRSVVALEQHAANVVDAHTLILRQLNILTHGRSWEQVKGDELLRMMLADFTRDLSQVSAIGITDATGRLLDLDIARRCGWDVAGGPGLLPCPQDGAVGPVRQ